MLRLVLILLLLTHSALADDIDRIHSLYKKVKCPTCAGQSIDESNTKASEILKDLIKAEIQIGKSDEEILREIGSYYGEDIILKTNHGTTNMLIWLLPTLFILYSLSRIYCIIKRSDH